MNYKYGSFSNRYRHKKSESPRIEIAPFVDVTLVLLIIFMLTAPLTLGGVDVDLPQGQEKLEAASLEVITITYSATNKIYINDQEISLGNVITVLKEKTHNNFYHPLYIRSDKSILYGNVMLLVDNLNKAGYKKTILVTQSS